MTQQSQAVDNQQTYTTATATCNYYFHAKYNWRDVRVAKPQHDAKQSATP
jgi:hypothetical protein